MGRRTGLTPAVAKEILNLAKLGLKPYAIARLAGVPPQNLYDWLKRGAEGRGKRFVEFYREYEKNTGLLKKRAMMNVAKEIADGNTDASFRYLEKFTDMANPDAPLIEINVKPKQTAIDILEEIEQITKSLPIVEEEDSEE